ncbi:MAG: hypothetical protein ABGX26_00710 [Nautiliaceae bacterium]|jgi:hypothetical protein
MKKAVYLTISGLIFLGCSTKINPNEFTKINAQQSSYKPSKQELYSKTQVLVVPFNGNRYNTLDQIATNRLKTLLSNYKAVVVLNRNYSSLKKEIQLAEEAKKAQTNLNQADYIIKGKILSTQTSSEYIPPSSWKDKKGKIHYTPAYYSNKACVFGSLTIIKIPQNYIAKTLNLSDCEHSTSKSRLYNFSYLLSKATSNAIEDKKDFLYNFFAKKGYVYEVRKKDNKTILHTTLGSNFGAREGVDVEIFTIKETKVPFSNEIKREEIKIGEGEISNVLHPNDSWIIVDKVQQPVKIGDYVKIHQNSSFLEKLKSMFK